MALTKIEFPRRINIGDSIDLDIDLASYPAGSGWSLKIAIVNATQNYAITATADGDTHSIDVPSTTSAGWTAGSYKWLAFAIKGTVRDRVSSGDIEILADPLTGAVDMRSHAEKVLASLEAMIEGKATTDDYQTQIRGKALTRYSPQELREWRNVYRYEVQQERRARNNRQGKSGANQKRVRF